ncbi:MAG: DnaJ domain-containing protein [Treponema sp.]|nr:DnaJ domain-containing protein [Treponema sp.]
MENYYSLLGVSRAATTQEIKRAFREKAKRLHPDIAGESAASDMRRLLLAYQILSRQDKRFEYDRAYSRFSSKYHFDYRTFLRERPLDPESQAKLIFFELLHLEEDDAVAVWKAQGGLDYRLEKYLDREDWMDCSYLLAEELARRGDYYESFSLLVSLVKEERRKPYFRHFAEDIESFLKEIVRLHLRKALSPETYLECLEAMLGLGLNSRDKARVLRSMAETLAQIGETSGAVKVFREALKLDPSLPNTKTLRRKLNV